MRKCLALIVIFSLCFFIALETAPASDSVFPTSKELARLPDVCKYTADTYFKGQGMFSLLENIEKTKNKNSAHKKLYLYKKKYGMDMIHMHHYCRGLTNYQRAFTSCKSEQCRRHKIQGAIGEMDYVLKKSRKKFVLRPKLYHMQGQLYLQLNEPMKALDVFIKSIKANPKFVKGYLSLNSLFLSLNQVTQAENILNQGLRHLPNSKALLKRKRVSSHTTSNK